MNRPKLRNILSAVPLLANSSPVKKLAGGPTSDSWLLDLDGAQVVLRADKPLAKLLALNRAAELEVLVGAAQAGFGPAVLWASPDQGLLVTHYIPGGHWNKSDASSLHNVERLAKRMREIHAADLAAPAMDLEATARRYAKLAGTLQSRDLLAKVRAILKSMRTDFTESGFCHNDTGYRNIVDTGSIMLLDWEYAATGMIWFDLAGTALQNRYSQSNTRYLAEVYCGVFDEAIEQRLKLFSYLYDLIAALWYEVVCTAADNMANQAELNRIMRRISRGIS